VCCFIFEETDTEVSLIPAAGRLDGCESGYCRIYIYIHLKTGVGIDYDAVVVK
jgi:hypothetical protein